MDGLMFGHLAFDFFKTDKKYWCHPEEASALVQFVWVSRNALRRACKHHCDGDFWIDKEQKAISTFLF